MGYDVRLKDAITGQTLQADAPHHIRGGTYVLGGTPEMWMSITYNYAPHLYRVLPDGIRSFYGKTGAETMAALTAAIAQLGDDVDPDYWKPTEGNAKRALQGLLAFAQLRPDGVWDGD